ncbi:MAG TPA: hypothetical protein VMN36_07580 [Verrucomicrobiales bacterium]|nr:hypothetical protein [Verrucomicrobiales bacterium]
MCIDLESRSRRQLGLGFTLLEVVIAMTIFVVLGGTIFAIVRGSIQATSDLREIESEKREIEAFVSLLEATFSRFPPGGSLEIRVIETAPLVQELVLRGDPAAFALGEEPTSAGETTIAIRLRQDKAGVARPAAGAKKGGPASGVLDQRFFVGMSRPELAPGEEEGESGAARRFSLEPDAQGRYWMELLEEVAGLEWRVWDAGNKRWVERQDPGRPQLLEMRLTPKDARSPLRQVFEVY